jgi:hypothetical protein
LPGTDCLVVGEEGEEGKAGDADSFTGELTSNLTSGLVSYSKRHQQYNLIDFLQYSTA